MGVRHSTTAADTAAAAACVKRTFRREFQTLGRLLALTLLSNVVLARDKLYLGSQLTAEQGLAGPGSGRYTHLHQRKLHGTTVPVHPELPQLLKTSKPQPLRLRFGYNGLHNTSSKLTTHQISDIEHRFGPATVAILGKFLQVRVPQNGTLTGPVQKYAKQYCEAEALQAIKHGVNDTDILMAVTSSPNCTSKMLAWTSSCDWDPVTNRPTLGTMVICPAFFNQTEGEQLATMVHEVIHALGFVDSWFDYWYDQDTGEPYEKVYQAAAGSDEPAYLITPRVKAYAQEYFGCPGLLGAPLDAESQSHWNQRAIALDLMIPYVVDTMQPSRLTPFTLKALEDTGWYVANYTVAEEPEHGQRAGCAFVTDSCSAYKDSDQDTNYVCAPEEKSLDICTPDFRGIAYCGYGYGGCLAPVVDTTRYPDYPLLDCTDANSFAKLNHTRQDLLQMQALGGSTGINSRCLNLWQDTCTADGSACGGYRGGICATTSCVEEGAKVQVLFKQPDGKAGNITCTRGELVSLSEKLPDLFLSGRFKCPDPLVVCPTLGCSAVNCPTGKGNCWEGSYKCRYLYTGHNCSTSLLPPVTVPLEQLPANVSQRLQAEAASKAPSHRTNLVLEVSLGG